MIPLIRRFWPPALWREIEQQKDVYRRCFDVYSEVTKDASALYLSVLELRAENAELRRRLDTQQRRDHRGRFVGSVVRP